MVNYNRSGKCRRNRTRSGHDCPTNSRHNRGEAATCGNVDIHALLDKPYVRFSHNESICCPEGDSSAITHDHIDGGAIHGAREAPQWPQQSQCMIPQYFRPQPPGALLVGTALKKVRKQRVMQIQQLSHNRLTQQGPQRGRTLATDPDDAEAVWIKGIGQVHKVSICASEMASGGGHKEKIATRHFDTIGQRVRAFLPIADPLHYQGIQRMW